MTTRKKVQLKALTGIRFFAALGVVLYHYPEANSLSTLSELPEHFQYLVRYGYIGVSIFFVLSGFILAYNYVDSVGNKYTDYQRFWINRFARVYPLYLFALLLSAPFFINQVLKNFNSTSSLLETSLTVTSVLTLLQAWTPQTACKWNCPGWSLSAEAFFYFLFPYLAIYVSKRSSRKLIFPILISWIIGFIAPSIYLLTQVNKIYPTVSNSLLDWQAFIMFAPIFHLPQFIIGVLSGTLFTRALSNSSNNYLKFSGIFLPAWVCLFFILMVLSSFEIPNVLLNNGLLAPLFALLIYALGYQNEILAKFLSFPIFLVLGNASYAMYILHIPVLLWMRFISKISRIGDFNSLSFLLCYVALLTAVSIGAFYFIEKPLRKVVVNRLSKRLQLFSVK